MIHYLINDKSEVNPGSRLHGDDCEIEAPIPISFRLCMANVLISACQKISDNDKKPLAKIILPYLIDSVEVLLSLNFSLVSCRISFSFNDVADLLTTLLLFFSAWDQIM